MTKSIEKNTRAGKGSTAESRHPPPPTSTPLVLRHTAPPLNAGHRGQIDHAQRRLFTRDETQERNDTRVFPTKSKLAANVSIITSTVHRHLRLCGFGRRQGRCSRARHDRREPPILRKEMPDALPCVRKPHRKQGKARKIRTFVLGSGKKHSHSGEPILAIRNPCL